MASIRPWRLAFAVLLGFLFQGTLLAFGLHAELLFAEVCGGSLLCYWVFNGVYFTIGVAISMLVVPWGKLRSRLAVFGIVVVLGLVIGIIATHGFPGKSKREAGLAKVALPTSPR